MLSEDGSRNMGSLISVFQGRVARQNTGHLVKFEFQINNKYCFGLNMSYAIFKKCEYAPNTARGVLVLKYFLLFYVKFKWNLASCLCMFVFAPSGNPVLQARAKFKVWARISKLHELEYSEEL